MSDPNNVAKAITDKTRIIFFESPANPNMRLVDIAAVSEIAHRKKVLVAVDNTYCTPYIQKPITLGADIVIHSLTKYMNGHGDAMGGAIATSAEYAKQVRLVGLKDMTGACLSPHDANLILRGVKTLPVRMERIVQNTHKIAEYLQSHPQIKSIMYPGLPNFEQYQLAQRQMKLAGGLLPAS